MDTMPPQAPPAITTSQQQQALDAIARLAGVQRWLADQRAALPDLPDPPATDGRDAFLDRLTDYWRAPTRLSETGEPVARASALSAQWAAAMRDDAILLGLDGTLDERSVEWATAFARSTTGVPTAFQASELIVGDVPYAGAIVLHKRGTGGPALLFSPDTGWQSFASLAALHDGAERRMRETLALVSELPGVARDDIEAVLDGPFVSTRDAGPDAFDVMTARVAGLQEQRVASAWDDFAAGLIDRVRLADRVRDALDPHDHLDVHAMLARRDARMGEAVTDARLGDVPAAVRADWRRARDAYRDALALASQQRRTLGIDDILSLDAFTEAALAQRLASRGITDHPRDIVVRSTEMPAPGLGWLSNLFPGAAPRSVGLVELAYQNTGRMQATTLAAGRIDGAALSAPLDADGIRQIVRDADIATRYTRYLDEHLLTSTRAQASRKIAATLHQARMRFELEDSRLSYYRRDEPRAFRYADHDIGYRWMKAVVDAPDPATRATVDGHTIVTRQVTYRGLPLTDLFEVGTASTNSSSRVVYYTPDAPDGVAFREFYSREDAARDFFHHPAYETYLLDRLPSDMAEIAGNGTRRFKVSASAQRGRWVFAQENPGRYTRMEEHLVERDVRGNIVDALYDASVALMKANTAQLTRSTDAADWQAATHALASATAMSSPVATLAARLAQASVRQAANTMPALWRMEDNVKAGDHAQAFLDLVEAYHSSLNVIGAHPALVWRSPAAMVRAGQRSSVLVPSRQRIGDPASLFESRFIARGLDAAAAESVTDGVIRIRGATYIAHEGRLYGVRFDRATDGGVWRLTRQGPVDANFTGPVVERTAAGTWRHARGIGLRGGGRDTVRKITAKASGSLDRRVRRLSEHQVRALQAELVRRTGSRTTALEVWTSMRPAVASQRGLNPPLTPANQAHWYQALDIAERSPARLPAAPARVAPLASPPRAPLPPDPATVPGTSGGGMQLRPALANPPPMSASLLPPAPVRRLTDISPDAWPETAWVYLTRERVRGREGATNINLAQNRLGREDLHGLVALEQDPFTPLAQVEGFPAEAIVPGGTLGSLLGGAGWVRINLHAVRHRANADILPIFRVAATDGPPGVRALLIRPTSTQGDPEALRNVWLLEGEFQLGTWPTTGP